MAATGSLTRGSVLSYPIPLCAVELAPLRTIAGRLAAAVHKQARRPRAARPLSPPQPRAMPLGLGAAAPLHTSTDVHPLASVHHQLAGGLQPPLVVLAGEVPRLPGVHASRPRALETDLAGLSSRLPARRPPGRSSRRGPCTCPGADPTASASSVVSPNDADGSRSRRGVGDVEVPVGLRVGPLDVHGHPPVVHRGRALDRERKVSCGRSGSSPVFSAGTPAGLASGIAACGGPVASRP